MPAVERKPADAPPDKACDATKSMSGPGVQIKGSTVAAKKSIVPVSMDGIIGQWFRNLIAEMPF
jgi:hypothetical protein